MGHWTGSQCSIVADKYRLHLGKWANNDNGSRWNTELSFTQDNASRKEKEGKTHNTMSKNVSATSLE